MATRERDANVGTPELRRVIREAFSDPSKRTCQYDYKGTYVELYRKETKENA